MIDANRFPEKFYPGRFDLAGLTSHAIWHVFVCLGIFVSDVLAIMLSVAKYLILNFVQFHYLASLKFYANRYSYGCNMAPRH